MDAKKKALVGSFKNAGQTWRPKGQPELVNVYDFPDPEQGKAIPDGVKDAYPHAAQVLICADGGGSNGSRLRLWKVELQKWADTTHLHITVCHLPPETSKWNKIEHRLFSYISMNWRGQPLISHAVVVELIGGTTSRQGLSVRCQPRFAYPTDADECQYAAVWVSQTFAYLSQFV